MNFGFVQYLPLEVEHSDPRNPTGVVAAAKEARVLEGVNLDYLGRWNRQRDTGTCSLKKRDVAKGVSISRPWLGPFRSHCPL